MHSWSKIVSDTSIILMFDLRKLYARCRHYSDTININCDCAILLLYQIKGQYLMLDLQKLYARCRYYSDTININCDCAILLLYQIKQSKLHCIYVTLRTTKVCTLTFSKNSYHIILYNNNNYYGSSYILQSIIKLNKYSVNGRLSDRINYRKSIEACVM